MISILHKFFKKSKKGKKNNNKGKLIIILCYTCTRMLSITESVHSLTLIHNKYPMRGNFSKIFPGTISTGFCYKYTGDKFIETVTKTKTQFMKHMKRKKSLVVIL